MWPFGAPPSSLAGLSSPKRVRVRGTITTGSPIVSPLTGRVAAVFRWTFFAHTSFGDLLGAGGGEPSFDGLPARSGDVYTPLGSFIHAYEIALLTPEGRVDLPNVGLALVLAAPRPDHLVTTALPDAWFAPVGEYAAKNPYEIWYSEQALLEGDAAVLEAVVERRAAVTADALDYRRLVDAFAVRPDLGRVVIEDHSLDDVSL